MTDAECRELDFIDALCSQWKGRLPKLDEDAWLVLFPEMKTFAKARTRREITALDQEAQTLIRQIRNAKNNPEKDNFWQEFILNSFRERQEEVAKQRRAKVWYLRKLAGEKPRAGTIGPDETRQAKAVRLTDLIAGKGRLAAGRIFMRCPFHEEKTGSFVIYANNTFCCFGCHVAGDSIEYIKLSQKLKFLDAVRFLLNR
jgi:hypothetical protein